MFPVEIYIADQNENTFTAQMLCMREWLDHRRYEPSIFRYTFVTTGMLFRVEFTIEAEATAFAQEFGGRMASRSEDITVA